MDVKPLHAIIALLFFGSLLALASYSGMQARSVQGPSDLQLDHNDHLHVRIGQQLFVYDQLGQLQDTYSLDDFQVQGLIGNFDFFPDNSLLLVPEKGNGSLSSAAGRLLRCYRDSGECALLPRSNFVFDWSIRVALDESGHIYLSDTRRGRVYLLSPDGGEIDKLSEKLDHPNRLRLVGDELFIAHTEGEEVLSVPLVDRTFSASDTWHRIKIKSASNQTRREIYLLDLLDDRDDLLVLAKSIEMRSGAIYRYNALGEYRLHFTFPDGADPFAIARLGKSVAVADYTGLKIYLYSPDGELQGQLSSPEQAEYVAALVERQRMYNVAQYLFWGLFALALIVGFAIAIKGELTKAREKKADEADRAAQGSAAPTPKPHHLDARIHWLQASKKPLWLLSLVAVILLAMPLLIEIGRPEAAGAKARCADFGFHVVMWGMLGLLVVVLVPLWWKIRQAVIARIGVCDEWVLVDRGNGVILSARDEDLLRVANGFIIEKVTIPTGTPQMSLYDKKEMEQCLQPRLDRGQLLGPGKQLAWQWRNQRGNFILSWALVAAALAGVLAMELGWLEGGFEQWLQSHPACIEAATVKENTAK